MTLKRPVVCASPVRPSYPRLRAAWHLLGWPALFVASVAHGDSTLPQTKEKPKKGSKEGAPAEQALKPVDPAVGRHVALGGAVAMPMRPEPPPILLKTVKTAPPDPPKICRIHPHDPGEPCIEANDPKAKRVLVIPPLTVEGATEGKK